MPRAEVQRSGKPAPCLLGPRGLRAEEVPGSAGLTDSPCVAFAPHICTPALRAPGAPETLRRPQRRRRPLHRFCSGVSSGGALLRLGLLAQGAVHPACCNRCLRSVAVCIPLVCSLSPDLCPVVRPRCCAHCSVLVHAVDGMHWRTSAHCCDAIDGASSLLPSHRCSGVLLLACAHVSTLTALNGQLRPTLGGCALRTAPCAPSCFGYWRCFGWPWSGAKDWRRDRWVAWALAAIHCFATRPVLRAPWAIRDQREGAPRGGP